jgi:hypothetical protein
MAGPPRGDAVGLAGGDDALADPAELGASGEPDIPDPAGSGVGVDAGRLGKCCTAAARLTPKRAGGQWACHPTTASVPAKNMIASGTTTGNRSGRRRSGSGVSPYADCVAPMFRKSDSGPGSRSRSADSCSAGTSSAEPHLRQKRAKSRFCCPHVVHCRPSVNAKAPPQAVHKRSYAIPLTERNGRCDSGPGDAIACVAVWRPPSASPGGMGKAGL